MYLPTWRMLLRTRQRARDALEYGILVAVVAVAIIAGLGTYSQAQRGYFTSLAKSVVSTSPDPGVLDSGSTGCTPPPPPTVTQPGPFGDSATTGDTYQIQGTSGANTTVTVYDSSNQPVNSQTLSSGATTYSIGVPIKNGPNAFHVAASTLSCGPSGSTTVPLINGT